MPIGLVWLPNEYRNVIVGRPTINAVFGFTADEAMDEIIDGIRLSVRIKLRVD